MVIDMKVHYFSLLLVLFVFIPVISSALVIQPYPDSGEGYFWYNQTEVHLTSSGDYEFADANFPERLMVEVESLGVAIDGNNVNIGHIKGQPDLNLQNIKIHRKPGLQIHIDTDDGAIITECNNIENADFVSIGTVHGTMKNSNFVSAETVQGAIENSNYFVVETTHDAIKNANFFIVETTHGAIENANFFLAKTVNGAIESSNFFFAKTVSGAVKDSNFLFAETVNGTITDTNFFLIKTGYGAIETHIFSQ